MIHKPKTDQELNSALTSSVAGDEIQLEAKTYYLEAIYRLEGITLKGAGPDKTTLIATQGQALKADGNCNISGFKIVQSGDQILCRNRGNVIENVHFYKGAKGLHISGWDHVVRNCLFESCGFNGIDVNGGLSFVPELGTGDKLIRFKAELGLVDNAPPTQEWTPEQLEIISNYFYHNDQNILIEGCVGIGCGWWGGTHNGAFMKLVPSCGGVTIRNCIAIRNVHDYWFDFPSSTPNIIEHNVSIDSDRVAFYVEGYNHENAKAIIRYNYSNGAHESCFVSAFPHAEVYGNTFQFTSKGLRVHGLSPKRKDLITGATNPASEPKNVFISQAPDAYNMHLGVHDDANNHLSEKYDMTRDTLLSTVALNRGVIVKKASGVNYDDVIFKGQEVIVEDVPMPAWVYDNPFYDYAFPAESSGGGGGGGASSEELAQAQAKIVSLEGKIGAFADSLNDLIG